MNVGRPLVERRVQCPQCGSAAEWRRNAHRPFCSLACRLIDLGAWIDERHRIPGAALTDDLASSERASPGG